MKLVQKFIVYTFQYVDLKLKINTENTEMIIPGTKLTHSFLEIFHLCWEGIIN
jgi:hypothetical protein